MKLNSKVILVSLPGLRSQDLSQMRFLQSVADSGQVVDLDYHFPAVTWPTQANMLTGKLPRNHGVISNGFFWRDSGQVEMWTAWNDVIESPQIWDLLHDRDPALKSAAWFPMLSKGCGADFVCMPAPIHQPDGSEDLWCYTKPQSFYGELIDEMGHFPLQHFWGPAANIKSSTWIANSAVRALEQFQPDFMYMYLPHLDYAAQKHGPNSAPAAEALQQLDSLIELFFDRAASAVNGDLTAILVSEYVISEVDHVSYPNRHLAKSGLLQTIDSEHGRVIDYQASAAWCLVDHQFSHIFVRDRDPSVMAKIADEFRDVDGIAQVLTPEDQQQIGIQHPRGGDLVLVSDIGSWQAYYWWEDDSDAPDFARTVDIHRKPGYDPVELFFDHETRSIPLDATLVKGSHGIVSPQDAGQGIAIGSKRDLADSNRILDTDICGLVLKQFD